MNKDVRTSQFPDGKGGAHLNLFPREILCLWMNVRSMPLWRNTVAGNSKGANPLLCSFGPLCTITMICAIRSEGVFAPMILDGAKAEAAFLSYWKHTLFPALSPDDVVAMDNRSAHKTETVKNTFSASGKGLLYLPAYSPDYNPMENMGSKAKAAIRRTGARTLHGLIYAVAEVLDSATQQDCRGYFENAGYMLSR